MAIAKTSKSGLIVYLPKGTRLRGPEVDVCGSEVVLRERSKGLSEALRIIRELPEDMLDPIQDSIPQKVRR